MPFYGNLTIGRLTLTEDFEAKDVSGQGASGARALSISGQEAWPPLPSADDVRYRGEQLLAMDGMIVPVLFTSKSDRNGFYLVDNPSVAYTHYDGNISKADWSVSLVRLGTEAEIVFESRLVGGQRTSYYGGPAAERWHAPSVGNLGYYTGSTVPGNTQRTGFEGAISVYRGIPAKASPRWGSTPSAYLRGAARILVGGDVMCGLTNPNAVLDWEVQNTLLKVDPNDPTSTFTLSSYVGGLYHDVYTDSYGFGNFVTPTAFTINIEGIAVTDPISISILRNDPEEVVLRATYSTSVGFSTVDFSLRRGSRFVSLFCQHEDAAAFTVFPATSTAATDSGQGWIRRTANDANGNRFVIGSAERVNVNTSLGSIENAVPALTFGAFVGTEYGGSAAVAGDQAANLAAQYLGTPVEVVRTVRR